jgi:hypothetical protein
LIENLKKDALGILNKMELNKHLYEDEFGITPALAGFEKARLIIDSVSLCNKISIMPSPNGHLVIGLDDVLLRVK